MSGCGTRHGFVVSHKTSTLQLESRVPHVVQAKLDEGLHLATDSPVCDLQHIEIGMPVESVHDDISADIMPVQFRRRRAWE